MYNQLTQGLYTSEYALKVLEYRETLLERVPVILKAAKFVSSYVGLNKTPDIYYYPLPNHMWGCYTTIGHVIINLKIPVLCALSTIGHEFVHAHQVERGDLIINKKSLIETVFIWKGKQYDFYQNEVFEDELYKNTPWEIEAINKEPEILLNLCEHLENIEKIKLDLPWKSSYKNPVTSGEPTWQEATLQKNTVSGLMKTETKSNPEEDRQNRKWLLEKEPLELNNQLNQRPQKQIGHLK